ncbi:MAG: HDIG domain-containing protein [Candidatus Aminicenantes bacterium]|nr:HDIG domain-containing protein [Candidatus Aminicenantes bacterium]
MNFDLELKKKKRQLEATKNGNPWIGKLLIGIAFVAVISYVSYRPPLKTIKDSNLKVGDIAVDDIVIRKDMTVEDREMTELNRQKARANLIPVYEFSEQKIASSQMLLNEWFEYFKEMRKQWTKGQLDLDEVRSDISSNFGIELTTKSIRDLLRANVFGKIDLHRLQEEIAQWEEKGILLSKIGIPKGPDDLITIYSEKRGTTQFKVTELYDSNEIREELNDFLKQYALSKNEHAVIIPILLEYISANVSFSKILTRQQEEKALSMVNPVFIQLKKNKIILRRGDEINKDHLKLVRLIRAEEITGSYRISGIFMIFMVFAILFYFFWRLHVLTKIGGINRSKLNFVSAMTFIACAVSYRLALFVYPLILNNIALSINIDNTDMVYGIPFAIGSLLIAFLFSLQSAVTFSIINAIISGIICDWNFKVMLFVLAGNLAVAFGIEFYQRLKRSSILKAGFFWLLPVNVLTTMMFALTQDDFSWRRVAFFVVMGILSALLSVFIANFLIPLWEVIFKVLTDLKLVEITNLNLPVFREMLEKAPGTYHHSQMVASLAESAAQELQLSPILLRAMALYHDIGKIDSPQFFTENASVYENPHGKLTPRESAKIIIAHISAGMEKAESLKLPRKVAQSIDQHHGTKLVKYFYEKAKESSSGQLDDFDENMFRYPGKKPQEIEQAIIMLADQVEAASKSLSSPNDQDIKNVIEQIISADIAENQFSECRGLTFQALNIIAGSFYNKLASIYHQRIAYPGFDFKKENVNDSNPT